MNRTDRVRRQETMLLPECVEDYVSEQNPVRVLDVYIENLDLGALGFDLKAEGTVGAPVCFEPKTLLELLVYGYLNQIRSSRKLEAETRRNLEVIWLTEKAQPKYWTINQFRKNNAKAFREVLRDFHKLCRSQGLFGEELEALDGSFFKAQNNKSNNFTEAKLDRLESRIDAAIEAYERCLDEEDVAANSTEGSTDGSTEGPPSSPEDSTAAQEQEPREAAHSSEPPKNLRAEGSLEELEAKKRHIGELRQQAQESESGQVSGHDPDSRLLKKGNQSVVGHNVQSVVDGKHHLLAHVQIVQSGNDRGQLYPMMQAACEALEITPSPQHPVQGVADGGYFHAGQIARCEESGIEVHVPAGKTTAIDEPGYRAEDFTYEPSADEYICPEGHRLQRHSDTTLKEITYRVYYNTAACRECPCRQQCTKGQYRKLRISQYRETEQAVARRLEEHPETYARRKELAEHPFGTIKSVWGYREFMVTGAEKCEGELNLMAFCYNWKRAISVLGVEKLMEAVLSVILLLAELLRSLQALWRAPARSF